MALDLPSISLQKPLGTDIYNVEVFNQNSTLIEQYLNKIIQEVNAGLQINFYPSDNYTSIDIDTIDSCIAICDNLNVSNILGTFPLTVSGKSNFILITLGNNSSSKIQFYVDLYYSANKLYFRSKPLTNSNWSEWLDLSNTNLNSGGISLSYISNGEFNLDSILSGIYFINDNGSVTLNGTLPDEIEATGNHKLQLISYGDAPNNLKTQTIYDLSTNPAKMYTRYMYENESGNYVWSEWQEGSMGGGSSIKLELVDLPDT